MANIVERVGEMLKQLSPLDQRAEALVSQLTLKEKVALLSGLDIWRTVPIERLGLPSITMTDGPHGVRASRNGGARPIGSTTAFPTGVSMASTWNPDLIEKAAAAMAEETRAMGCEVLLGPCVNIVRHPLGGRNFESYSEDPYLAGRIGVAWVKGLQSQGVAASLKHFACNNQEFERFRGNSVVDERTLREIYLPQFEAVVKEAKPWTVMCSYNRVDDVYACGNDNLLNQIARGLFGFKGFVMSDWGATHTPQDLIHGLDMEQSGSGNLGKGYDDASRQQRSDERPHLVCDRGCTNTVNESSRVRGRGHRFACRKRCRQRSRGLNFDGIDLCTRTSFTRSCGDPGCQATASIRDEDCIHIDEILEDLESDGAVAGHDSPIGERMDKKSVHSGCSVIDQHLPPFIERHLDYLASEPLDRVGFRFRRMVRNNDATVDSEFARAPRNSLRHVAGARGIDAPGKSALA